MDGLECSEISYAKYLSCNRLDSEYYLKKYLSEEKNIYKFKTFTINTVAFVTDGQHGYHKIDNNSMIHMLTAKNTKNWFADIDDAILLAKEIDKANKRSSLEENDILLSTRGSVGYCAIVKRDILPSNIDQDVARIKIHNKGLCPEYVGVFLNTKYGQDWMRRNQTGMVQQGLSLDRVRDIPIVLLGTPLQQRIVYLINQAYSIKMQSSTFFSEAKSVVENSLALFSFAKEKYSTKKLSESFLFSGRLDAEYYQPKYEQIVNILNTSDTVGGLCKVHDENFMPQEDKLYRYVELANVDKNGNISNVESIIGAELPTRARRKVKLGQVIVSSIEGSLQSCALITDEYNDALCSTGFYVLDSAKINSETLLVLFKSDPIQNLLKQRCSGTILTAISKDEFLNMPLPKIDVDKQQEIAQLVQKSFALRRQSKQMLDNAIKAVEMAIETNEKTAIAWLETQNIKYIEN